MLVSFLNAGDDLMGQIAIALMLHPDPEPSAACC